MKQLAKLPSVLKRDPYPLNLIIDFGMDPDIYNKDDVLKNIGYLSESQIDAINFRYKECLSSSETADIMGITKSKYLRLLNDARIYLFRNCVPRYVEDNTEEYYEEDDEPIETESVSSNSEQDIGSKLDISIDELVTREYIGQTVSDKLKDVNLYTLGDLLSYVNKYKSDICCIAGLSHDEYYQLAQSLSNFSIYSSNIFYGLISAKVVYENDDYYLKKGIADSLNAYMRDKVSKPLTKPSDRDVHFDENAVEFVSEYIDWFLVSGLVKMSSYFIEKNIDKLDKYQLSFNRHISESFVIEHLNDYEFKYNLINLYLSGAISLRFIAMYGTKVQLDYAYKIKKNNPQYLWLR